MYKNALKKLVVLFFIVSMVGCGYGNLDYVKERANDRWAELGFEVVGYDGYNWGVWCGPYGGAKVWYVLNREEITYGGYLQRWGNEMHMYNLRAYDAIRPE